MSTTFTNFRQNDEVRDPLDLLQIDEGWNIDSPASAEWALHKIRQARAQRDRLIDAARGMIAMYECSIEAAEQSCQQTEDFFTAALIRWFDTQEKRETKTMQAVDLPTGKLIRAKESRVDYVRDDERLLPYLRQSAPEMVKTKESVDWAELKKHLHVVDGMAVLDTGEIVDGITTEVLPPEFKIKL